MLPGALIAVAVIADSAGAHGIARDALLAGLPFAAVAALVSFGDFHEARDPAAGFQALCSSMIVCLLVLSCAARSSAVHGVPAIAISSLIGALCLLALKLAVAGLPHARRLGVFWPAKP